MSQILKYSSVYRSSSYWFWAGAITLKTAWDFSIFATNKVLKLQ